MQEFGREERVGAEIHRELALLLRDEARDPRLNQVTVQEVRVVRDLSHAKVYFTTLDPAQAKVTETALNKAAAFLRHRLAETMKNLRTVPRLAFVYDKSIENGLRLSSLIDQAIAHDEGHGK
ncbi:MAG: 30S ribosome-binding factor RbfA [Gammaproteobacteria bacterium]|nr:30S ribosome-binding factor RbfA [Gammaproteobacteria bacterium]MCB1925704.1 30S ribosome-binding factor RbfA [Gammaproteobacteria bacterium]